jgi:hypothetical protein
VRGISNGSSLVAHAFGLRQNEDHRALGNIDNSLSMWNG